MFILTGGPGSSGLQQFTRAEPFKAIRFYREFADVVVFDQRGAGGSIPNLQFDKRYDGIPLEQPVEAQAVARLFHRVAAECRAYWVDQGVDLSAFNTHENAADVNELRAALGYEKIILIGGSYGSHLGLHLIRRYPQHIDRAMLYGIEGMDHTYDHPGHLLNAYRRIAAFAEESGIYRDRLPEGGLLAALDTAIRRLEDNPVQVTLTRKDTTYKVWVTPMLARLIGTRGAGSRDNPQRWPELVLAMYEGDYSMAARAAMGLRSIGSPNAMKYAMDHASGVSATRQAAIKADPAQHLLGAVNVDYETTESAWSIRDLGPAFRANISSDVPVLLIHGTWDTSTPIENAREVAANLKNGHLIEVVRGNHGALFNLYEHWPPARDTLRGFLTGSAKPLPNRVVLDKPVFPRQSKQTGPAQAKLWEACRSGNIKALQQAIREGADLNALDTRKNRNGRRPLNWAAWFNHTQVIEILLKHGADINLANRSGFTPLHHAVEHGSPATVHTLLLAGADASIQNKRGQTPLQLAKQLRRKKIVALLE